MTTISPNSELLIPYKGIDNELAGYHLTPIKKGVFGDADKIIEETNEFADAINQGSSLMALIELSDLYGAIQGYLAKHHPSLRMDDLAKMSEITQRAFVNGRRG